MGCKDVNRDVRGYGSLEHKNLFMEKVIRQYFEIDQTSSIVKNQKL
jgi:hypothetical protein